jgi:hypothetical protein
MEAKDYWGYWINVVQELRVKINELEKKVKELESRKVSESRPKSMADLAGGGSAMGEKELTVCMALKELGKPATVEEINEHLRSTKKIEESMKETLFIRLKGAMEKGYVGFDQKDKKFILLKKDFVVG